jgi:pyridoxine 4-dehydrogenase
MQLAGPQVFGPPRDTFGAIAVLREAIASGVNHIDTSDYYGPHVTNQIIKQALYPYPKGLVIVTKLGARRGDDKSWIPAVSRQDLIDGIHDNLGLSNVTPHQLTEAQRITEVVCVQNLYNVAHRHDDAFIDTLAQQGIGYVPFFPLGGFTPLQSSALDRVAASVQATPMQVALAWLLQRSFNILLIPGTSSIEHLRENLAAATLELPSNAIAELNAIGERKNAHSK